MKTILNHRSFNAMVVGVAEPVESGDLSGFEGEGGSVASELAAEWIDDPLEHGLWQRHRLAADQSQSAANPEPGETNMNKSRCPHCGIRLGNFLYADAYPSCQKQL